MLTIIILPYFVYILKSETTSQYYIGHTDSIPRRLSQHNNAEYQGTKHTKRASGPWICVYNEVYASRAEAMKREKEIKAKKSRKYIEFLIESRQSPEGIRD